MISKQRTRLPLILKLRLMRKKQVIKLLRRHIETPSTMVYAIYQQEYSLKSPILSILFANAQWA